MNSASKASKLFLRVQILFHFDTETVDDFADEQFFENLVEKNATKFINVDI
jgi:hypothetical protein